MSKIRLFGTSSGYVEIAPAAAASNNTLTAPSTVGEIIAKDAAGAIGVTSVHTTNITATGIATITTAKVGAAVTISESGIEASGIGITCANINGTQIGGRRNIIINGAMEIAQRGTSSTTSNVYTIDRFHQEFGGTDEAPTYSQVDVSSGTSPYAEGFRKALRITNGNQSSGTGNNDYLQLDYRPEAQDIAKSGWNYTSPSSFITLSFWIKSSVAHNFQLSLRTTDGTSQSFQFRTGGLSADTWTKVVKKIPGNSNLQFDNDNAIGMNIFLFPYIGNAYTSSSNTLDAWQTSSGTTYGVVDAPSFWSTNDATMDLTGVQLEVGPEATPFEHRSFAEELKLCQRYYYKSMQYGFTPQQAIPSTGQQDTDVDGYLGWVMYTTTSCRSPYFNHPVDMRTEPTVTIYSSGRVSSPTDNRLAIYNGVGWLNTATCSANVNAKKVGFNGTVSSALTATGVYLIGGGFDCNAEL